VRSPGVSGTGGIAEEGTMWKINRVWAVIMCWMEVQDE